MNGVVFRPTTKIRADGPFPGRAPPVVDERQPDATIERSLGQVADRMGNRFSRCPHPGAQFVRGSLSRGTHGGGALAIEVAGIWSPQPDPAVRGPGAGLPNHREDEFVDCRQMPEVVPGGPRIAGSLTVPVAPGNGVQQPFEHCATGSRTLEQNRNLGYHRSIN